MNTNDQREKLQRFDAEISRLADAVEVGRKVIPVAMAAVAAAGIVILAIAVGKIGFDPMALIGGSIPLIVGILFLAWCRRRLTLMAALLQIAKENRAQLVDEIDPSTLKK